MATTLADIRTEVQGRGAKSLPASRVDWFINAAHSELCNLYPWPFLETTTTVAVPATISDVRYVLSVNDSSGNEIAYRDRRELAFYGLNFTDTGVNPSAWYWTDQDSITTFPVATGLITFRYLKGHTKLVNNTDLILIPDQWADVLVDGAFIRVHKNDDAYEELAPLRQEWDRQVANMVQAYFNRQSEPDRIIVTQQHDRIY